MARYTFTCDLVDDPTFIAEYEAHHVTGRPEIKKSIRDAGITDMQIFRFGNRMFMIMETDETFSFDRKTAMDAANPQVQEWEQLMWKYQQAVPGCQPGEKWVLMKPIFYLNQ